MQYYYIHSKDEIWPVFTCKRAAVKGMLALCDKRLEKNKVLKVLARTLGVHMNGVLRSLDPLSTTTIMIASPKKDLMLRFEVLSGYLTKFMEVTKDVY